ncbi:MAG: hypothetical protein EXR06_04080 [Rickettsiales bacterium]|nr:hypothetical protein [Rickettsiales bacterium]
MTKRNIYICLIAAALSAYSSTSLAQGTQKSINSRLDELESKISQISQASSKSTLTTALENARLSGRLHIDGKWYNNKESDAKKDGIDIRRARLAIDGNIGKDFYYKFDNSFTNNKSELFDAYIAYIAIPETEFRVGHYRPPFSLEQLVGSNTMVFIERSVVSTSSPGRHVGFQASTYNAKWHATAGIFGETTGNESRTDDSQTSASARVVYAPVNNLSSLIHLGLAGFYASKNRNTAVTGANTTANAIDKEYFLEAEMIVRQGSTEFQAEYTYNHVNYDKNARGAGLVSTTGLRGDFNGYYAQISTLLTGEHRDYKTKTGIVSGFKVNSPVDKNGIGAWEIAARYASDNRNDNYRSNLINGGNTKELTLGVNWYLNDNVRMMFNYQNVDRNTRTAINQRYDGFSVRTQLIF